MAADGATEARVRWMLVGNLGGGDVSGVTPDGFAEALAKAGLGGEVTVADRLGAAQTRTYKVFFPRLKSFSLAEIVATTEPLASLRALAEALASGDAARRPSTDDAIAKVNELVGPGELLGEIEAALRPAAPAAASGAGTGGGNGTGAAAKGGGAADGIFGQADLPGTGSGDGATEARGAIGSFVKAMRGPSGGKSATGFSAARDVLERAVFASAADILANPGVQQMESILARREAGRRQLPRRVEHAGRPRQPPCHGRGGATARAG